MLEARHAAPAIDQDEPDLECQLLLVVPRRVQAEAECAVHAGAIDRLVHAVHGIPVDHPLIIIRP